MTSPVLDQVLREQYVVFDLPADQLVRQPDKADVFCDLVRGSSGELAELTNEEITRRLLNLRRRGEDKGGLPRIRH